MIRVLSVLGTRPEAIKMAPLLRELSRREGVQSLLCVTAQHREMLDQALASFGLAPDYDLDLMRARQRLPTFTAAALSTLDAVLGRAAPDLVLVHGDTSSCLAGALAAFYRRVPIGHVEAGLRSGDLSSPFPEEMNRQLTDRLSDLLFAPTAQSRDNLLREGLDAGRIFVTGNTVVDALRQTAALRRLPDSLGELPPGPLILLTAHRRENLGEPLQRIFRAAKALASAVPGLTIVCPLHKNPAVREAAAILSGCAGVRLIEPPEVFAFHALLARSDLVLTDSGGVQEEAAALGRPTLVLRDTTERPEGLACGALRLVGTDEAQIVSEALRLLGAPAERRRMSQAPCPFGDGRAAERIAEVIEARFGGKKCSHG